MNDMPERIWACIAHDGRLLGMAYKPVGDWQEYVRADVTPSLDALAMQRAAALVGYRVCAETRHVTLGKSVEAAIDALPAPTPADALAEALRLPQVKALVEALKVYADGCDAAETTRCGYTGNLCCGCARTALAALPKGDA